jgi:hypothetical protein
VIAPDPTAIASFLAAIAPGLHLCSILPDGRTCSGRWFGGDVGAATDWALSENQEGKNVYWTVNLVKEGVNKKPAKPDIVAARFSHVDIDPPKDGSSFDKLRTHAELVAEPVPPSLIIDSGGGLQAFWRITGAASLADVEAVNKGLAKRLGGDNCHSIDHLMRVPGTVNYPNAKKRAAGRSPALAKVIHDADRVFH